MSYEHLRGVMGGTPHTTTGSATASATAVLRPHLSLVPEARRHSRNLCRRKPPTNGRTVRYVRKRIPKRSSRRRAAHA